MVKEQAHNMMNLLMELRTWIQTMQLCAQATCDVAFPMEIADNLVATEERLLTCSISEVRWIRWSCSYAQVWFEDGVYAR
jgi:hypothetical protein